MRSILKTLGCILLVALCLYIPFANAQNVTNTTNNTAVVPPPPQCALDEYPATENGTTICKKVPTCKNKDEITSYDNETKKFVCKKLVVCDPKRQQAAYINGKTVCMDIPNCEGQGKHYAFDGTKLICQ